MSIILKNLEDTEVFAEKLANRMKNGHVYALIGDLGAGKTTLTQNICKYLKIEEYITSPTFNIVNEYSGILRDGKPAMIYHFDVYRINSDDEMYDIGFDDYVYGQGVCIIEWANIIEDIMPENTVWINMKLDENMNRIVDIRGEEGDIKI